MKAGFLFNRFEHSSYRNIILKFQNHETQKTFGAHGLHH